MILNNGEEALAIEIVCDDVSHYDRASGVGKLVTIQTFVLHSESGEWLAPRAVIAKDRGEGWRSPTQRVVGVPKNGTGATAAQNRCAERRTRYSLKCPLCDLNSQLRQERLDKLLDGVAMAAADGKMPHTLGATPGVVPHCQVPA